MEPTTGIEPVDLFLTKEALYRLSYVGLITATSGKGSLYVELCIKDCPLIKNRTMNNGAGDENRTRDIQLGRLKLCHLSYSR